MSAAVAAAVKLRQVCLTVDADRVVLPCRIAAADQIAGALKMAREDAGVLLDVTRDVQKAVPVLYQDRWVHRLVKKINYLGQSRNRFCPLSFLGVVVW